MPDEEPEIEDSKLKMWIVGGARTLVNVVPIAGGAIAQAWSEYDTHKQNERVEEYFRNLGARLEALSAQVGDLKDRIESMPDAAELLERTVEAAIRETSPTKRAVYSLIYSNFIAAPAATSADDRIDILNHVEHLTDTDLNVLRRFAQHGTQRGDMLTNSVNPGFAPVGAQREPDNAWLNTHGNLVHSLTKLTSRGLIMDAVFNAGIQFAGDSGSGFNRFRQKAWQITPMGIKVIRALTTNG